MGCHRCISDWTFILSFKKYLLSPFFMSGIAQRWAHNGDWHGPSWHGLSPWLLMSGSPENWGIGVWRLYPAASECTSWGASGWRKDCLCGFPVTDPESGSTELETETASSVEGRSLNPRVQKEQKEDFGGRLFLRVLWSSKHFISSSCRILQHPILWIYHSYSSSVSGHLIVSNFCLLQTEQL